MKKIVFVLATLFIASQLFVSCSADSDVLSQFSKRKYLKKYKAKDVKYEDEIAKREHVVTPIVNSENVVLTSNEEVIEPLVSNQSATIENQVELKEKAIEEIKKINKQADWTVYNRDFNYFEMNKHNTDFNNGMNAVVANNRASDIVLILLAIFLPPVAVIVFEDTVTGNFWLDLVLTILFWLPGAVYAFLVCFADVSV